VQLCRQSPWWVHHGRQARPPMSRRWTLCLRPQQRAAQAVFSKLCTLHTRRLSSCRRCACQADQLANQAHPNPFCLPA
jgi:hypothetical protein